MNASRLATKFAASVTLIAAAAVSTLSHGQGAAVDLGASPAPSPASPAAGSSPKGVPVATPSAEAAASATSHKRSAHTVRAKVKAAKRDELDPDMGVAIKDAPDRAVDLPGVLKLDGAPLGLIDPARARRISCTNEGSETVYLSATEPNRIQLPFPNPHIISTTDLEISKRPNNNNIYVTFAPGVTHAATLWLEPQDGSSVVCGLQAIPKRIPAQSVHIVDDTGATSTRSARAEEPDDFMSRVQSDLQDALEGRSAAGWSTVNVPVPPIVLNGVLVEGARRLSSLKEDIYVYAVRNPSAADVVLEETEFDGPRVIAVSILPSPLLRAGGTTFVAVLARKNANSEAAGGQLIVGGR